MSSYPSRSTLRLICNNPSHLQPNLPIKFHMQVFHYQQRPYPPLEGIFRKRIAWDGDVMGRDASIIIREVKFSYNGTYVCQVKNPPDVHGTVGEIRLRVVATGQQTEYPPWMFLICVFESFCISSIVEKSDSTSTWNTGPYDYMLQFQSSEFSF